MTSALLTDFYELTMIQGYYEYNHNPQVVYDMFFRKTPFNSGYVVFAGLEDLLHTIQNFSFTSDDIEYLESQKLFKPEFLEYLSAFSFTGDIYAVSEGTVVFPNEPIIKVHAGLIEAQLVESILLNIINFQSLIATKTARIFLASKQGRVLEFGLRRAQGTDGAMSASRASFIGGALATSNTLAGKKYGIPVSGTMAHSWVMSFPTEEESFMKYAELYPDTSIFLIDTYDSLGSGIENAVKAGKYLKKRGKGFGIRLDSGDLQYLSQKIRKKLDEAGFPDAKIAVSNELDEHIINQLVSSDTPIDLWGVGTQMVTGGSDSALSGVYKLVAKEVEGKLKPVIKVSNHPEKTTTPADKRLIRFYDSEGSQLADLLCLFNEEIPVMDNSVMLYHPMYEKMFCRLKEFEYYEDILHKVMEGGEIHIDLPGLRAIRDRTVEQLNRLDTSYTRLLNPHIYKVSLSEKLRKLKLSMIDSYT